MEDEFSFFDWVMFRFQPLSRVYPDILEGVVDLLAEGLLLLMVPKSEPC